MMWCARCCLAAAPVTVDSSLARNFPRGVANRWIADFGSTDRLELFGTERLGVGVCVVVTPALV